MSTLTVTVELFGMARRLAGAPSATLDLPEDASLHDVAAALARRYPQLRGRVFTPDGDALIEPYLFNLDGRTVLHDLDRPVAPDEPLCLMFVAAGG